MADLNIGIAQAIWATNPFFVSILEKICYGQTFNANQIWGMLALVLCAMIVSLSGLVNGADEDVASTINTGSILVPQDS